MKKFIRKSFLQIACLSLFGVSAIAHDLYVCPMKCYNSRTYTSPGKCPKCGMPLEKVKSNGEAKPQSDDFHLDFRSEATVIEAGKAATFVLIPKAKDNSVPKLDIVHEKVMHLILVSKDLNWFDHVHPQLREDGSLLVSAIFPADGKYVLFADFTPLGFQNQVFPIPVTVQGKERPFVPLPTKTERKRKVSSYEVALVTDPKISPNTETSLAFNITLQGKKVTDLEPLLGAKGHCVIISEDTKNYLHTHPADHGEESAQKSHASHSMLKTQDTTLLFHTRFPRAGAYKAWLQFKHQGQLHVADFTIRLP